MTDRTPRLYFSFRSPYSWLAYHDLVTRYADLVDRLRWVPFFEPDQTSLAMLAEAGGAFPYVPMSKDKSLYILQDVRRLAAARGLQITWPVDRAPWWEVPHLAYLVAARLGGGPAFVEAVYRARWQEGRDICDPAVVGEIAAGVGLDGAAAAGAVHDPALRKEGVNILLDIHRTGVFGVPFFVAGFDKYWGVDRLAAFVERLGRAPVPAPQPAPAHLVPGPGDGGHAGGCG